MWYKATDSGQATLSVGKHLVTKDSRFSVAYYSIDHGFSPPKWDLHITNVRLSDAAYYQCHVVSKDNRKSTRSNVKLVVEGKQNRDQIHQYLCKRKEKGEQAYLICRKDNHGRVRLGE
jgi:hypothetical protein